MRDHVRPAAVGLLGALLCLTLSASSLPVDSGDLGSVHSVVAACDSDIGVSWSVAGTSPVYAGNATVASSTFDVSRLRLTDVDDACAGQSYDLQVVDSANTPLVSQSGTVDVVSNSITFTFAPTNSKTIERAFVTIHQ